MHRMIKLNSAVFQQKKNMGELNQNATFIPPQDLRVTTLSTTTLHPSEPTERRLMFLSNIDQVLNFSVETVHFFKASAGFPAAVVVERLRSAVERLLVSYDFLAGRLRFDESKGRKEIDCNAGGVRFVVASSGLELGELGQLEYPNPAFRQLASPAETKGGDRGLEDQPLCTFQVTSFKCGGFALGISTDHSTFDGISFRFFLKNLAALAFDKPLAVEPYNDRQLLAARSPPRVSFSHPELLKLDLPSPLKDDEQLLNPPPTMLDPTTEALEFKLFHLDPDSISALKAKAKTDSGDASDPYAITSFNVIIAHLWRCKALATNGADDKSRTSTVLYAVDIRRRLSPPLPSSYTGNAILSAYATAACHDLENGPFSRIVAMVREGATRMSDEYIRSVIDWGQIHKGFPCGDVFVSSWWKLGFEEVEYPWGTPAYSCPVPHPSRDIVLLFPSIQGAGKGVNVLISLPKGDTEKFESLFYKFLG